MICHECATNCEAIGKTIVISFAPTVVSDRPEKTFDREEEEEFGHDHSLQTAAIRVIRIKFGDRMIPECRQL